MVEILVGVVKKQHFIVITFVVYEVSLTNNHPEYL
jgi:hypothetical protein